NERGVRRDHGALALRAIAERRRDDECALASHFHGGNAPFPALDDLMLPEHEREGPLTVHRAIELGAFGAVHIEPAGIMDDAGFTRLRAEAGSSLCIGDL